MNFAIETAFLKSLEDLLPSDFRLQVKKIQKNNGAVYQALCTEEPDESGAAPLVYLEPILQRAESGEDIRALAAEAAAILNTPAPAGMGWYLFEDFESLRDRVIFRLINREMNREWLSDLPGRPFLDLYVSYGLLFPEEGLEGMTPIRKNMADDWGVTEETLYELAMKNTKRLLPPRFRTFSDIFAGDPEYCDADDSGGIFIITNCRAFYGASVVLFPEVLTALQSIAQKFGGDIFLIPSSIHEWIVFIDEKLREGVREIIATVNLTSVAREDILGSELYRLSGATGELTIDV